MKLENLRGQINNYPKNEEEKKKSENGTIQYSEWTMDPKFDYLGPETTNQHVYTWA